MYLKYPFSWVVKHVSRMCLHFSRQVWTVCSVVPPVFSIIFIHQSCIWCFLPSLYCRPADGSHFFRNIKCRHTTRKMNQENWKHAKLRVRSLDAVSDFESQPQHSSVFITEFTVVTTFANWFRKSWLASFLEARRAHWEHLRSVPYGVRDASIVHVVNIALPKTWHCISWQHMGYCILKAASCVLLALVITTHPQTRRTLAL